MCFTLLLTSPLCFQLYSYTVWYKSVNMTLIIICLWLEEEKHHKNSFKWKNRCIWSTAPVYTHTHTDTIQTVLPSSLTALSLYTPLIFIRFTQTEQASAQTTTHMSAEREKYWQFSDNWHIIHTHTLSLSHSHTHAVNCAVIIWEVGDFVLLR